MTTITRLPEVKTLYEILPRGTEGGKEFARIVDLLLFYAANRKNDSINLFSDRAGDYFGLDSFQDGVFRQSRSTGYQYKFFPSPLSAAHRAEIISSLKKTSENQKTLKLKKWILVTPDDLVESSVKGGGGDVAWFKGLRLTMKIKFEIEHWGHRKLQALMIDTPRLCLYYYPELVIDGLVKRKTVLEVRKLYDKNLAESNDRIEFIGMSVYKPEATHGVPIEEIYIPVSTVPFSQSGTLLTAHRTNPLDFLSAGSRHVILGDPGSGKSTLLKFLLMAGQSAGLQGRYDAKADGRLPLLITLRKYGDELKKNKNIPILDYICQTVQADLSIPDADRDFIEYYLESGQAIILFDGLDELPDASFKQMVRDRVSTFLNGYPMITAIITSRVVGYNPAFGFNSKKFDHHQIAPLLFDEIKCFVRDWYTARIENHAEREINISDLLRILSNPDAKAIRTLAENPLLLTIVALVHRIDAVLPDERVVLYQKCTETLLNTWHMWKYKAGEDFGRRGRIERTNRRRIENLALYMHTKSGEVSKKSRAILSEDEVIEVLVEDIMQHDDVNDKAEAKDVALNFLEFIKQKAGLLIEVGNREYSFIHLTFQEYLSSTRLSVISEMGGVQALWISLQRHINDPRWHEVIRLLIAGLKSDDSQAFILEEVILNEKNYKNINVATLLGGLLIDGVKSAEKRAVEIIAGLFKYLKSGSAKESGPNLADLLHTLSTKCALDWDTAFRTSWQSNPENRPEMLLLVLGMEMQESRWEPLTEPKNLVIPHEQIEIFAVLLGKHYLPGPLSEPLQEKLRDYHHALITGCSINEYTNFMSYIGQAAFSNCEPELRGKYWLQLQISALDASEGPFSDLYLNCTIFSFSKDGPQSQLREAQRTAIKTYTHLKIPNAMDGITKRENNGNLVRTKFDAVKRALYHDPDIRQSNFFRSIQKNIKKPTASNSALRALAKQTNVERIFDETFMEFIAESTKAIANNVENLAKVVDDLWNQTIDKNSLPARHAEFLVGAFTLKPPGLWQQAIKSRMLTTAVSRLPTFNDSELSKLLEQFKNMSFSKADILSAAGFLIYDIWLFIFSGFTDPSESPLNELYISTLNVHSFELDLARCLRDLTHGKANRADISAIMQSGNIELPSRRALREMREIFDKN